MPDDSLPEGLENFDMAAFEEAFVSEGGDTEPQEPKEPAPTQEKETSNKWVHEPTGKEFDNEVDYLKHDSGYNNSKWGERFKALEAKIEELGGGAPRKEEPNTQQKTEAQIRDELIGEFYSERVPENLRNDESLGMVRDMMFEMLKQYDAKYATPQWSRVQEALKETQSGLQEYTLRSKMGVDQSVEQQILEKHPKLKALEPDARLAVIADLVASAKAGPRGESRKLVDKIPQPRAEDHVEGSVKSSPPDSGGEGSFDRWLENDFSKKSVEDQEATLSKLIQEAGRRGELDLY